MIRNVHVLWTLCVDGLILDFHWLSSEIAMVIDINSKDSISIKIYAMGPCLKNMCSLMLLSFVLCMFLNFYVCYTVIHILNTE